MLIFYNEYSFMLSKSLSSPWCYWNSDRYLSAHLLSKQEQDICLQSNNQRYLWRIELNRRGSTLIECLCRQSVRQSIRSNSSTRSTMLHTTHVWILSTCKRLRLENNEVLMKLICKVVDRSKTVHVGMQILSWTMIVESSCICDGWIFKHALNVT